MSVTFPVHGFNESSLIILDRALVSLTSVAPNEVKPYQLFDEFEYLFGHHSNSRLYNGFALKGFGSKRLTRFFDITDHPPSYKRNLAPIHTALGYMNWATYENPKKLASLYRLIGDQYAFPQVRAIWR